MARPRTAGSGRFLLVSWVVLVGMAVVAWQLVVNPAWVDGARSGGRTANRVPDQAGPVPLTVAAADGNLVLNWSFEQDLRGWGRVGTVSLQRCDMGRTSGSAAELTVTGRARAAVGAQYLPVVGSAPLGHSYVAWVWVWSDQPGLAVTLDLVGRTGGPGGTALLRSATARMGPKRWQRIRVAGRVTAPGSAVGLKVTAAGLAPGRELVLDEVGLRNA
jgi:hypothetical protein